MKPLKNSKNAINSNEIIPVLNRTSLPWENSEDLESSLNDIGVAKHLLMGDA